MTRKPFEIKICGVTTPEDAKVVARAGADAIGLNFYPKSKRFVALDQAAEIVADLPSEIVKVAVFVNSSYENVMATLARLPIDVIQFHGDETPDFLAQFAEIPIVRAFPWDIEGGKSIHNYLERCLELSAVPQSVLIDSYSTGQFGGTGKTSDWSAIGRWTRESSIRLPTVLAGGLTPGNVAAAIAESYASAVDTASGVESSPGRKDAGLVNEFVRAARTAFRSPPWFVDD